MAIYILGDRLLMVVDSKDDFDTDTDLLRYTD